MGMGGLNYSVSFEFGDEEFLLLSGMALILAGWD